MSLKNCIKTRIENEGTLANKLYSLILFGSYIRGDFIERISDIDFFAVFYDDADEYNSILYEILKECTFCLKHKLIDLPWANIEDVKEPLKQQNPFKFLTIYQEDFLKHHKVIYGKEINDILPRYDKTSLLDLRAKQLLRAPQRFKDNPELLMVSAGEVIRFMAIAYGAKSISKTDVMEMMKKINDKDALNIFKAYLEGRELQLTTEYLSSFITTRITKYLENRS